MKLKDEIGMIGPKSACTKLRFVGIVTSTIYPYACTSSYRDNPPPPPLTHRGEFLDLPHSLLLEDSIKIAPMGHHQ